MDTNLVISIVNTKLRNSFRDLDSLCEDLNIDKNELVKKLNLAEYEYSSKHNQFVIKKED